MKMIGELEFQEMWIRNNLYVLERYMEASYASLEHVEANSTQLLGVDGQQSEVILNDLRMYLGYSLLLLAYAHLDEFLVRLTDDLAEFCEQAVSPSDLRGNHLKACQKFIHEVCRVPIGELSIDWGFLNDFGVLRNTIIHANGNASLVRGRKRLAGVMKRYEGELEYVRAVQIVVLPSFVRRCIDAVQEAAVSVNTYLITNHPDAEKN